MCLNIHYYWFFIIFAGEMRHKRFSLLTFMAWILLMIGCTGHRYPQALLLVDSLADEQPDSCLRILAVIDLSFNLICND